MIRRVLVLLTFLALALTSAAPAGASVAAPDGTGAERAAGLPSKATWLRDVDRSLSGSRGFLRRRAAAAKPGERLAVVLDIDNTSIASHYAWPRPVKRTRAFARRAAALGMTVHFATGRTRAQLEGVPEVLREAGYRYRGICVRRSPSEPLQASKLRCRKALERRGFTIVASVGNRLTDLQGGHTGRRFKLPDYGGRLS
ncbi:HAD family acid phosphatase [Nocardioides lianchengensis]|uniref:HAD superfamily, subfamily IIIB (Acid phosphatase) n=1 Tax=Nocardioides lianchengensis TaxID=1045774 RepID=A0A1G6W090_9ACTN|nr:HAD family acid phosphatase [Nocardioides lianchengensis]NYG09493.1 hypothetical protein [Nocardioides lianchengensis]SDD59113.1 HAD superfamily, subfamily IIIB (Acid phosphatase) [Nocardioides lianchengensis]